MNRYDLIFIIQSDVPKDEIDEIVERYKGIVANLKGTVVKAEKWGIRRLAYKIEKQGRGFYVLLDFVGNTPVIRELERNLKFDDKVLRYQTVKRVSQVSMADIEKEMAGAKKEKPEEIKEVVPAPGTAAAAEAAAPAAPEEAAPSAEEGSKE
jgi:small subunit ribosomal protein S6